MFPHTSNLTKRDETHFHTAPTSVQLFAQSLQGLQVCSTVVGSVHGSVLINQTPLKIFLIKDHFTNSKLWNKITKEGFKLRQCFNACFRLVIQFYLFSRLGNLFTISLKNSSMVNICTVSFWELYSFLEFNFKKVLLFHFLKLYLCPPFTKAVRWGKKAT